MPDYSGNKAKASDRASEPCHEIKKIEEENRVIDYKLHSSYGLVQMVQMVKC